jgi:phospholipid/cholesterol/gamma-HCH transport system substrate-binding protein
MKVTHELGWSELKVGIIAAVAIGLLVMLVLKIEQRQGLFSRGEELRAHLTDLKGLRLGAPVQFSGVEVGNVKDITFEKDAAVTLTMTVRTEVRPLIKKTSRMSIESMGVLGDKLILISAGSPEDLMLPEGEFLDAAMQGGTVFDVMADAAHTMSQARAAVEQFNVILERVTKSKGSLGKFIEDPALFDETHQLIVHLNKAMDGDSSFGKFSRDPALYNALQHSAEKLEKLLGTANSKQGSLGKFVNDEALYNKMEKLTEEVTNLAKDIRENPKKYFKVSVF